MRWNEAFQMISQHAMFFPSRPVVCLSSRISTQNSEYEKFSFYLIEFGKEKFDMLENI